MTPDPDQIRHTKLFELLRQENLCDVMAIRRKAQAKIVPTDDGFAEIQAVALKSWRGPAKPMEHPTDWSAAKPGGDYKFFRTVGA